MGEIEVVKSRKETHSTIVVPPAPPNDEVVEIKTLPKVINLPKAVKRSIVDHRHVNEELRGMDVRRVRNRYPLDPIAPMQFLV